MERGETRDRSKTERNAQNIFRIFPRALSNISQHDVCNRENMIYTPIRLILKPINQTIFVNLRGNLLPLIMLCVVILSNLYHVVIIMPIKHVKMFLK